jgi:hypothetical protein
MAESSSKRNEKMPYNVITWFNQPDGRTKLYLTTRDRLEAEKATHVFAGLIQADVVELKPDKNGLYEATLRPRVKGGETHE